MSAIEAAEGALQLTLPLARLMLIPTRVDRTRLFALQGKGPHSTHGSRYLRPHHPRRSRVPTRRRVYNYSALQISLPAIYPPQGNIEFTKLTIILASPDKNPGRKNAHERFARLGIIAQILRDKEGRER